jgi:hypothetical protein
MNKYLMTFQNLLSRVPKWNSVIIEEEKKRIIERSGCNYLEDLITCVHIIQLKVLTCIRVGNKQKKIDISIPKLDAFIHKIYINTARKLYMNVYLFEKSVSSLQQQKHSREMEIIIQECILTAIRESIPTEEIIRAYMDESVEREEEVVIENVEEPELMKDTNDDDSNNSNNKNTSSEDMSNGSSETQIPDIVPSIKNIDDEPVTTKLSFNDFDSVLYDDKVEETVNAPKSFERLEEISMERNLQRKLEEEDDNEDRIKIDTGDIDLGMLDIFDLNGSSSSNRSNNESDDDILLNDIVEL